jgi:hypothetical protein
MGYADAMERGGGGGNDEICHDVRANMQGAIEKWRANFGEAMRMNYVIWPAAAFINYKFVPIQHRIGYISVVSLFWGTILSLINSTPREKSEIQE